MRYLFVFLFSIFLISPKSIKKEEKPFVMIQLFTSQGCSSCPPADRLVEKIKEEYKNENVYLLAYHVDYWNRLGWKDPYSKKEFTEMQYKYADVFKERQVYTPQIVLNGNEHFVGSDEYKLRRKLKSYLKKNSENLISISTDTNEDGNLQIQYSIKGDLKNKKLKLAFVLDNNVTHVKRGENSNRKLSNSNIVLEETTLEIDDENKASLTIPKKLIKDKILLVSYLQNDQLEITAASQIEL